MVAGADGGDGLAVEGVLVGGGRGQVDHFEGDHRGRRERQTWGRATGAGKGKTETQPGLRGRCRGQRVGDVEHGEVGHGPCDDVWVWYVDERATVSKRATRESEEWYRARQSRSSARLLSRGHPRPPSYVTHSACLPPATAMAGHGLYFLVVLDDSAGLPTHSHPIQNSLVLRTTVFCGKASHGG